jgi:uncharacterized RDD family membrane protein YckC
MRCPTCDSVITHKTGVCSQCEAALNLTGAQLDRTNEDVHLKSDQERIDVLAERPNRSDASVPRTEKTTPVVGRINHREPGSQLWGGFIRRGCAFVVDWAMILLLGSVMFLMSHIGYKVGLSAHGRFVTMENSSGLYFILTWASIVLSAAYFVIFHSSDGRTIGKWIFGLRLTGAENGDVTASQALLRWLAAVGFAPILLGFLWVIWSREKRAWHDIIAHTWVIRE